MADDNHEKSESVSFECPEVGYETSGEYYCDDLDWTFDRGHKNTVHDKIPSTAVKIESGTFYCMATHGGKKMILKRKIPEPQQTRKTVSKGGHRITVTTIVSYSDCMLLDDGFACKKTTQMTQTSSTKRKPKNSSGKRTK